MSKKNSCSTAISKAGSKKSAKKVQAEAEKKKRDKAIASASIALSELTQQAAETYIRMKMSEQQCYVAPSYIGGNGLYILGDCKSGQVIAEYTGKRMDMQQIREEEEIEEGKYAHEEYLLESFSGALVIDASVQSAGHENYANHMCSPNCEFVTIGLDRKDGGKTEVIFIQSILNIHMFQEITVKYNWDVKKDEVGIVCNCRSPQCNGYIAKVDKKLLINKKKIKSEK